MNGEVVIVTGSARGLGAAYVRGLKDGGYSVVVADLNESDEGDLYVRVDVSDPDSCDAMARAVLDRFGRVDVLVNNAGYFTQIVKKPFEELTVEEWDHCFAVNVRGTWLATRAVVPAMKERRYGKIINTSSMTVPSGIPGFLHYVASKAASSSSWASRRWPTRPISLWEPMVPTAPCERPSLHSSSRGSFIGATSSPGTARARRSTASPRHSSLPSTGPSTRITTATGRT
jgi:NADP-dependent 3-hydroxy acid dehydrogenase YdfG